MLNGQLVFHSNNTLSQIMFPDGLSGTGIRIGIIGDTNLEFSPYFSRASFLNNFKDDLDACIDASCDIIFAYDGTELDDAHISAIKNYDNPKIIWCLQGQVSVPTYNPVLMYSAWAHLMWFLYQDKDTQLELESIHNYTGTQKFFSCLLGTTRLHKTKIYNALLDLDIPKNLYYELGKNGFVEDHVLGTERPCKEATTHEGSEVLWYPHGLRLLPYQNTVIDVFTESKFSLEYQTFTERVSKAILAKKPWLPVGVTSMFMQIVKDFGFKFDNALDYSYINNNDIDAQCKAVAEQLLYLYQNNYEPDQSVLDYNFDLYYNKIDWSTMLSKLVAERVNSFYS